MSVKIEGLRELLSNLSKKEEDIKRAARRANIAGGKVVMAELKSNVPRSGYFGHNPQTRFADAVVVSGNRGNDATGESFVVVGFNRDANFRVHIAEFGSISQVAHGYMAKMIHNPENEVQTAMANEINKVL